MIIFIEISTNVQFSTSLQAGVFDLHQLLNTTDFLSLVNCEWHQYETNVLLVESTGTSSPWQLLQWLRWGHSTKIWPNVSHEMDWGLRPGSLRWTAAEPMGWIAALLYMICSCCQPRKSLHTGCIAAKRIPFFGLDLLFIYYPLWGGKRERRNVPALVMI